MLSIIDKAACIKSNIFGIVGSFNLNIFQPVLHKLKHEDYHSTQKWFSENVKR